MFKRLRFTVVYALRNITRDRQRAAFALFSIAAGVATVVALRMLGLMLTDALTANARAILRGDVVVQSRSQRPTIGFLNNNNSRSAYAISDNNIKQIDAWAAANNIEVNYAVTTELMQSAVVHGDTAGQPAFMFGYFIDPSRYPFYDSIRAQDPPGVPLAKLFDGPNQVVIGRRIADQLGAHVGDTMRVGAAKDLQTVKGIVPDTSESNFENPFSVVFSFVYINRAYTPQFGLPPNAANKVYLKLPPTLDQQSVASRINREWPSTQDGGGRWRTQTANALLQQNQMLANLISRFVLLLSLVALVIGGVGIVNTLLVSVNRRSPEIAVLKTLGLQSSSVGLLFLVEAIILGLVGSVIGLGVGLLLSVVAQQFGEQAFAVTLPWRFQLEPLALGMGLGLGITAIFSIFPALLAGQVRPNLVLRSGGIPLARSGCIASLISLIVLLAGISAISEAIIGDFRKYFFTKLQLPWGVIGTLVTFVLIMIILGLIWVVVWFLGRLPSFRNANLRIAIRALTLHRGRTALSLMALIIGMTALSGTLIMTRSISTLLSTSLSEPLGGNVIALPLIPLTSPLIQARLNTLPGVSGYRQLRFGQSDLRAINGDRNFQSVLVIPDDVQSELRMGQINTIIGTNVFGNPPRGKLVEGRFLNADDAGHYRIVIPYRPELEAFGVHVGSTFTYYLSNGNRERTFEVVGIVAPQDQTGLIPFSLGDGAVQAPPNVLGQSLPFDPIIANVDKASLNSVMGAIGAIPGVFVFDVSVFDSIISRLLNQLAALPLLVAGLSLFAAAVLIATTVSLATMERRRQIAILKALGVTRRQALNQLLAENAIIGIVGGVISLLPTLLIIKAVPLLTGDVVTLPIPYDLIVLMLGLSVGITLLATLLTAWSASGEKPLAALRYE
ncbi:MAG: FtsX-like permease family protein [Chloroflexota bacterium]